MSFTPVRSPISAITQANPGVVTTSINHNLSTGQVVRINVPINYGMSQLNHMAVSVTVLSANTFSMQYTQVPPAINVNTSTFTAFTIPSKPSFTAEIIPIGSGPTPVTNVPWQALSNLCVSDINDATANISTTSIPF